MAEKKRLYRNADDASIEGVCSGLADYLDISPELIRYAFMLLAAVGGLGIVIYIVLWIVLPVRKSDTQSSVTPRAIMVRKEKSPASTSGTSLAHRAPDPDFPLKPGHVLQGRHKILRTIRISKSSAVYQASDLRTPDSPIPVAVKEILNLARQEYREKAFQYFEGRAAILATLDHPHIARVFDYFTVDAHAYLVMEYIRGTDLETLLNSTEGFLPVEQVRRWAIEICDPLSYLHNQKPEPVVFRDLTPGP